MQRLVDVDEVVLPLEPWIGRVSIVKRDAIFHAAARRGSPAPRRSTPRRGRSRRPAPSDRRARSPSSSSPGRRPRRRPEPADRRRAARAHPGSPGTIRCRAGARTAGARTPPDPRACRPRSRRTGLRRRVRNAASTASIGRTHATTSFPIGRDVVEARLVEKRLVVARRQGVAPLVVDVEDPRRRLLLEPFADVALVQARSLGKLRGRGRPAVGERAIEPEPHTDVHGHDVHRAEGRAAHPLDEGVAPLGVRRPPR